MTLDNNQISNNARSSNKDSGLSRDPNIAMQEMMSMIDALRSVYQEETDALQNADTKRFVNIQERKLGIAKDYQISTQIMLERKKDLKKVDPEIKQKLIQMQDEFSEVTATNLQALDKVRKAVTRLNDRLMGLARETASKESINYGARGRLENVNRRLTMGINESA